MIRTQIILFHNFFLRTAHLPYAVLLNFSITFLSLLPIVAFQLERTYQPLKQACLRRQLLTGSRALFAGIFSLFASTPPVVDTNVSAVTMVWKYIGELVFNMLVLVGTIKASDRVVREMMGL